ncbi:MAG: mechanosensitive ion channel family protein [Candidatus Woesearchaeota archaeon]
MTTIEALNLERNIPTTVEPLITNIGTAIIILLIGLTLGKLAGLLVKKIMRELEIDKYITKIIKLDVNLTSIISTTTSVIIYIATIIIALNQINIMNIVLNILIAIFLVSIIGTILLSMKDFFPNLISNLRYKKQLKVGKKGKTGIVKGEITRLGILSFNMKTKQKDNISIPYTYLEKNKFKQRNYKI